MRTGEQTEPLLEHLVSTVARGIAGETGPRFFQSLVSHLAQALGAAFVFAGELKPGADRVSTIAAFGQNGEGTPAEFDLAETPFDTPAAKAGSVFSYPEGAPEQFPRDPFLTRIRGEGYVGAPILDSSGALAAILFAVTLQPLREAKLAEELMRVFSDRSAAELEYIRQFESLERQNRELRRQLEELGGMKSRLEREAVYLREEIKSGHDVGDTVGVSPEFRALIARIRRVAGTTATVLIHGETGSGKDLAARSIHNLSSRRARPMVSFDCIAIPVDLLEIELFGGVRGAVTEAAAPRIGRLDYANGGTLLIHEVAELPLEAQAKLLRCIQQQEFRPLGSNRSVKLDVRLLATTNRNLEKGVREGWFRSDLYDRLSTISIEVPPLRRRRQDIPLLVEHFLRRHARRLGSEPARVSDQMMRQLTAYDWPGNIRELRNFLFRAALSRRDVLDVPVYPSEGSASSPEPISLEDAERRHVDKILTTCNWVIEGPRGAAAALKLPPSTLRSLMKRLGIQRGSRTPAA